MIYAAYQSNRKGTDFSFEDRDGARGILGKLRPSASPVAEDENLDELRFKARAYLGEFPEESLYLTDSDHLVHGIMINKRHHELVNRARRRGRISIALLVFCTTCLLGSPLFFGAWGLVVFATASAIYLGLVRFKIFNEIEGGVVCEMLLVILMVLIPGIQRAIALHAGRGS